MSDAARLTLVVAIDAKGGIGIDNKMPWHLPEDFAHFKRVTLGKPVIMGRKTFDSIGRVLPGRRNIVITRNAGWSHEGAEHGDGQIFAQAMDVADTMIVTHIDRVFDCDTFFPPIDAGVWRETARDTHHSAANGFDYAFVTYARREATP